MKKNYSEEFRKALKRGRKEVEKMIAMYLKQRDDIADKIYELFVENGLTKITESKPVGIIGNMQLRMASLKVPKEFYENLANLQKRYDRCDLTIGYLEDLIADFQTYVNTFNNDKATKAANVEKLFLIMKSVAFTEGVSNETLCAIFGMNACATALEVKKGTCTMPYSTEVAFFADYYNPDGSFKYNADEMGYIENLLALIRKVRSRFDDASALDDVYDFYPDSSLGVAFSSLLSKSNIEYFEMDRNKTVKKEEFKDNTNYELLARLREYYRGGEIVQIPEDIEEFKKLLTACQLSEKEISFILGLVNAKINEFNQDINLRVLKAGDLEAYQKAKRILESLYYTDPDYYVVVATFQDLTSISELILDSPEDEYLLSEKDSLIAYLNEFNDKHDTTERVSDNNLIILGDYFKEDLDVMARDKKDRVLSVLGRITKDNQGKFRKILTGENIDYVPYEFLGMGVHISFVEIDTGIYVLLGASIDDTIYRNTVNRLLRENSNLKYIEEAIKDENRRNTILLEAESVLNSLLEDRRK